MSVDEVIYTFGTGFSVLHHILLFSVNYLESITTDVIN